jgi:hypothetical protein
LSSIAEALKKQFQFCMGMAKHCKYIAGKKGNKGHKTIALNTSFTY